MADIQDGYAASMQAVDPVAAGVLSARLGDSAMTYQGRYSDIAFKKAEAAAQERVTQIVSVASQEIIDSAIQPGATRESIEASGAKLLETQLELGVKEENARRVVDATLKQAVRQNRLYLYDNAYGIVGKRELLEEYEKNPLPGYTYEQNRSFMISLENNLKSEVNRIQQRALDGLNDAMVVLGVTGKPPEDYFFNEDAIDDIFPPEQAAAYKEAWADANEDVLNRGALSNMSPARAEEITQELLAEVSTSPDSAKAAKRHIEWVEAVANRSNALKKDSGLFVAQTNESAAGMIEDIQGMIADGNIGLAAEGILILNDIAQTQFDSMETPPAQRNIMPKAFASQMVNIIQNLETDIAPGVFSQITSSLGDVAPKFIEELRAQGMRPEYVQSLYINDVNIQKELLEISGRNIEDIKVSMEPADINDTRRAINMLVADYREGFMAGGGNIGEQIFNEQYMVIEKLALTRLKDGYKPIDAAEHSVADIIKEFDQVVLNRQGKYVIPFEFDAVVIEQNASMFFNEQVLKMLDLQPLDSSIDPDFVDEAISIAAISSNGMWLNNSTGDGLTLHYSVNDELLPVLSRDGSEYEVKFSEMSRILNEMYAKTPEGTGDLDEAAGYLRESRKIIREQTGVGRAPLQVEIDEAAGFAAESEAFATGARTTE